MGIQAIKGVEVGDGFALAAHAAARGPRRDRAPTDDGIARTYRPRRRHRGRHVHRRGAARPGGHEADRDGAARAAHGRRRHRRGGRRPPPALRRVRRPGRRRSSPRRWSRSCWPTRCWRSSAATRSPRPGATSTATSTPLPSRDARVTGDRRGACWSGPGRRQDHRRPAARRGAGACRSATPTTTSGRRGQAGRRHLRRRRRGALPRAGADAVADGAGRARRRARPRRRRGAATGTRERLAGRRWCSSTSARRRASPGSGSARPAAAARQRARRSSALLDERTPASTSRSRPGGRNRRAHAATRSPTRSAGAR